MSRYNEQWARLCRWYDRLQKTDRFDESLYGDYVYSFFQNAWHFKEWLKNDPELGSTLQSSIEDLVAKHPVLLICADIANGSKHLTLNKPRSAAGEPAMVRSLTVTPNAATNSSLEFELLFDDGMQCPAIDLGAKVMAAWKELLANAGIKV